MKTLAIIGIIWFSFLLLLSFGAMATESSTDINDAEIFDIVGLLYALPFAIVVLVQTNKKNNSKMDVTQELLKLNDLKDKGILSDEEFKSMKMNLLRK